MLAFNNNYPLQFIQLVHHLINDSLRINARVRAHCICAIQEICKISINIAMHNHELDIQDSLIPFIHILSVFVLGLSPVFVDTQLYTHCHSSMWAMESICIVHTVLIATQVCCTFAQRAVAMGMVIVLHSAMHVGVYFTCGHHLGEYSR